MTAITASGAPSADSDAPIHPTRDEKKTTVAETVSIDSADSRIAVVKSVPTLRQETEQTCIAAAVERFSLGSDLWKGRRVTPTMTEDRITQA